MTTDIRFASPEGQEPGEGEARVKVLAVAALDELPEEYAERLENVQFFIEPRLSAQDRRRLGIKHRELYGLYEGIPLTRRGDWYSHVTPDRITIYWEPILRDSPNSAALADLVRKTVLHEIGHYFGLSEDDLSHTRVG
jgi:predicted Zn-dependent protease with MMP-like domain